MLDHVQTGNVRVEGPLHLDSSGLPRPRRDCHWGSGLSGDGGRQNNDSGGQSQRRKVTAERYAYTDDDGDDDDV